MVSSPVPRSTRWTLPSPTWLGRHATACAVVAALLGCETPTASGPRPAPATAADTLPDPRGVYHLASVNGVPAQGDAGHPVERFPGSFGRSDYVADGLVLRMPDYALQVDTASVITIVTPELRPGVPDKGKYRVELFGLTYEVERVGSKTNTCFTELGGDGYRWEPGRTGGTPIARFEDPARSFTWGEGVRLGDGGPPSPPCYVKADLRKLSATIDGDSLVLVPIAGVQQKVVSRLVFRRRTQR